MIIISLTFAKVNSITETTYCKAEIITQGNGDTSEEVSFAFFSGNHSLFFNMRISLFHIIYIYMKYI